MASSELAQQMNRSLETKLALYENMVAQLGPRPVIFTSRAEIWSTDPSLLIITGHPFPSISPSDNPNLGDLTRGMMEYYRNLPTLMGQGEGRDLTLILFEFEERGSIEVHAAFSRSYYSANKRPEKSYFKTRAPAFGAVHLLIRQYSTDTDEEKTSVSNVLIALADENVVRPAWFGGDIRFFQVTSTSEENRDIDSIKIRLGPELCLNLNTKVNLFELYEFCTPVVDGMTFTSVPYLWKSDESYPWKVIPDQLPQYSADYDHELFDIEQDIFDYITDFARRYNKGPFLGYSRRFGDSQFANVHLLFIRNESFGPTPSLLSLSSEPMSPRSRATMEHRSSSIPAATAGVDERASGAGRPLSLESLLSDSASSAPPVPPRTEITTVDYRPLTTSEEESIGESQSLDSASRDQLLPPCAYSSSAGAGVDQGLSSDSTRSDQPSTYSNLVPAMYRSYSSAALLTGVPEAFIQRKVLFERNILSSTSSFDALSTNSVDNDDDSSSSSSSSTSSSSSSSSRLMMYTSEYDRDYEMRPVARRLGCVLMRHLDEILRVYASRSAYDRHWAYIFTDNWLLWSEEWNPVITIIDLPPIPPLYNHESNDIVWDMVDYMCRSYMRKKADDSEAFFVSTLLFGTGPDTEVHILLSQQNQTTMQYYLRAEIAPTLDLPEVRYTPAKVPQTSGGLTDAQDGGVD